MFLQSYVVPVCLFVHENGAATIKALMGSAFFVNNTGLLISARHVLEHAQKSAAKSGMLFGIVVKEGEGKSPKSSVLELKTFECAPKPYDIAVSQTSYKCETFLTLRDIGVEVWQDIASYGYPISAVSGTPDKLDLNIRCHKGYVQRVTQPGHLAVGEHPEGFELNFLVSKGSSGSPLFIHKQPRDIVIGVCVGSHRSEFLEDQHEEVYEDGTVFREKRLKIEEYGFAQDIRPLLDWKPQVLKGASLRSIV